MPAHTTTRFGISGYDPTGSDLVSNIATIANRFLDQIDADFTGWASGVIARIPTAGTAGRVYLATDDRTSSPNGTLYFDNGTAWVIVPTNNYAPGLIGSRPRTGTRGQFYYATDDTTAGTNGTLYLFDGTGWNQVQTGAATSLSSALSALLGLTSGTTVRRGKSIIPTSEARTNTAYGLLTTPDRVQAVVLPTDGLILVGYQALWKETVVAAASAALFLGSNQVAGAEVGNTTGGTINVDKVLATHGGGLSSSPVIASAQVTTGQLLGDPANAVGGFCTIFAAAGTYDVSVQFKASSGTVTVNSRKLWVTTMALA